MEHEAENSVTEICYQKTKVLGRGRFAKVALMELVGCNIQVKKATSDEKSSPKIQKYPVSDQMFCCRENMFALKRISKRKQSLERYQIEIAVHKAASKHPCVAKILEQFKYSFSDEFGFGVEYCQFGNLADFVQMTPLSERWAKSCVAQIGNVLNYIHRSNFVYLDLKPENILIYNRQRLHVKLTDFGTSRTVCSQIQLLGPDNCSVFTSPEMTKYRPVRSFENDKLCPHRDVLRLGQCARKSYEVSPTADVWAIGVLILVLLNGRDPWLRPSRSDVHYKDFQLWREGCFSISPKFVATSFTDHLKEAVFGIFDENPKSRSSLSDIWGLFGKQWLNVECNDATEDLLCDPMMSSSKPVRCPRCFFKTKECVCRIMTNK